MKKTIRITLSFILFVVISIMIAGIYRFNFTDGGDVFMKNDPKNISYTIDGETFSLIEGKASKEIASGSATKNTFTLFEEPVYGVFGEGKTIGAAVLLVNTTGGSGTFYYAALAVASGTSYVSTNVILLGDRIAPQTITVKNDTALYTYATRKDDETMSSTPSVGVSTNIYYDQITHTIRSSSSQ